MTTTALRPGPRAASVAFASPFTPIGHTPGGTPIYPAQGGRSSGGGIDFVVDDGDDDDPFASRRDDDDDDDDGEPDDEPAPRGRGNRRTTRRDQDEDGDADGETDWTPPDRESFERLTTALRRANSEAGKRRRVGKTMERLGIDDFETWLTERGIDPTTGQPYGIDVVGTNEEFEDDGRAGRRGDDYEREDDRPRDDERTARQRDRDIAKKMLTAEQRGRRAEREALMPVLAEQTARAALRDAGFTGTKAQLERMLYSIRPGSLELEMDGDEFELVGLDEEIESLRESFPERFRDGDAEDERRPARRTGGGNGRVSRGARDVDGGDRGRQPKKAPTWLEQASAQMARRGR